jgi:hypothetical protein
MTLDNTPSDFINGGDDYDDYRDDGGFAEDPEEEAMALTR